MPVLRRRVCFAAFPPTNRGVRVEASASARRRIHAVGGLPCGERSSVFLRSLPFRPSTLRFLASSFCRSARRRVHVAHRLRLNERSAMLLHRLGAWPSALRLRAMRVCRHGLPSLVCLAASGFRLSVDASVFCWFTLRCPGVQRPRRYAACASSVRPRPEGRCSGEQAPWRHGGVFFWPVGLRLGAVQ